ncbi:MAG: phosphoribosylanthranilate isomerase [Gammaproteobacteria bacterium]|nr:MAG: phosphoribosylanthranilate isomerase [Gammaproteobacteria bacterium]
MSIFVKICGLRSAEAVKAAIEAGADALGFVFADSPRRIEPEQAAALCAALPAGIVRVAVMRDPRRDGWEQVSRVFRPDWLQAEAEALAGLELEQQIRPLPVFRDTPALDEDLAAAEDRLLFEGATSGAGQRADWARAARLARRTRLLLAGGLDPENVADAIARVQPWGVDVSSGVERRRGEKDPARIAAFVAAVRAAETAYGL